MKSVVYVAPFFGENSTRTVDAFASLEGAQVGVISQQPLDAIPPELRAKLAAHYQVPNCLDPQHLATATRFLAARMGRVDRLVGALEQLQIPLAQARQALDIEGMWEQAARNFREKNRMKDVLNAAGVPVARHRLVRQPADAWSFVDQVGYPIVLKPPAGLGAAATFRVSDAAELAALLERYRPSHEDPVQCEEFVRGVEENTFETVSIRGEPVWWSGTRYLPGPLEVLENPWMQYCVMLPREREERFERFAPTNRAALKALGMGTGLSHMEWFKRADGVALVNEVGARPPGVNIMAMMGIANDFSMERAWARLMTHDVWEAPSERKYAAGCAFFRGQGQGRVRAIHGMERAQEECGEWVVSRKLPVVGQPKSSSYEGEGWAIVRHPDTRVVMASLKSLISNVQVELG